MYFNISKYQQIVKQAVWWIRMENDLEQSLYFINQTIKNACES